MRLSLINNNIQKRTYLKKYPLIPDWKTLNEPVGCVNLCSENQTTEIKKKNKSKIEKMIRKETAQDAYK